MVFVQLLFGFSLLFFSANYGSNGAAISVEPDDAKYLVHQGQLTWNEAFNYCQRNDMKMAETFTYDELKELRKYIRSKGLLPRNSNEGYWLGGKLDNSFTWIWTLKNEAVSDKFLAGWQFGRPIRKDFFIPPYECMELQYKADTELTSSLSWNDISCNEKRGVICEVWGEHPEEN